MSLVRLVARPLLASTFVVGSYSALKNAPQLAEKAKPVADKIVPQLQQAGIPVPQDPVTQVRLNAAVQLVAALALAKGTAPRISSAVLAASIIPTTVAGHAFWAEQDQAAKQQQMLHFAKNTSILGGLALAAVDTAGKPGLAYRAGAASRAAKREAKHLRREAKLAAKAVTS